MDANVKWDAVVTADELVEKLAHFANGMSQEQANALAVALAHTHPTLLGQIAKTVAVGVMRRATRDIRWRPFDGYADADACQEPNLKPRHAAHDGRLSCDTVIGAELMAHQQYI
jgi:hypothetical protein